MWTRVYLLLVAIRLYFALCPSYIHPDENFQGPEVIAGEVFSYPNHLTWEFSDSALRSVFPLWPVYGLPMEILRWLYMGISSDSEVPPRLVYYTLRFLMFMSSFLLEDWAIYELVPNPRQRRVAVILVASSYVTWTYQTHTFSNSVETLVVLWCLVLMQRIVDKPERSSILSSALLGVLLVFGTFNRITFPAFLIFPLVFLIPHFQRKPLTLLSLLIFASTSLLAAIVSDTEFYIRPRKLSNIFQRPVLTPLNSLLYNTNTSSLAEHGLHPRWQHFLVNFPLLLLPALPLLVVRPSRILANSRFVSAVSATAILSIIPHQEPRFLIPIVPLLLSCINLPNFSPRATRVFATVWISFNLLLGIIYGRYHQAGVVPMQMWLGEHKADLGFTESADIFWWKTYSPPIWLLNAPRDILNTTDLMGGPSSQVEKIIRDQLDCPRRVKERMTYLVVPRARDEPGIWKGEAPEKDHLKRIRDAEWTLLHSVRRHVGLDDLDFAEDGIVGTFRKVVGRRGLDVWKIRRQC